MFLDHLYDLKMTTLFYIVEYKESIKRVLIEPVNRAITIDYVEVRSNTIQGVKEIVL